MWCFRLAYSYVQDISEQPVLLRAQLATSRSIASSYWTRSVSLANLSRETYHNRRRAESVVGRQSMPSWTRLCPRNGEAKRHFRTQWCTSSCLPDRFESDINFVWWHRVILYYRRYCEIAIGFTLKLSYVCLCYEYFYIYTLLFRSIRPGCIV